MLMQGQNVSVNTSSIRSADEVRKFFSSQLDKNRNGVEVNWHLPYILEDVNELFHTQQKIRLPKRVTEYSKFLRQFTHTVLDEVLLKEADNLPNLSAVYIQGSVAYGLAVPFHVALENEVLPEQTSILVESLYTWLFSSLGKSSRLSRIRLLDHDYSSQLNLLIIVDEDKPIDVGKFIGHIDETFISLCNFSPPISVKTKILSEVTFEDLISSYWIRNIGFSSHLLESTLSENDEGWFYTHYVNVIKDITQDLTSPKIVADLTKKNHFDDADQIVANYQRIKTGAGKAVSIDKNLNSRDGKDNWLKQNEIFFKNLKAGKFDVILVEDATKYLGDKKGSEKENQFTLCKVLGLKQGDEIIRAKHMMLKLRGLSWYRGEVNNLFDSIKEFASYSYINKHISDPGRYFLFSGPLLLTCEKLDVPFDRNETDNWVGIFLEELSPSNHDRVLTCRVRRISDFWSLDESSERVMREAAKNDIELEVDQLSAHLRLLSNWLWSQNLSIDYCDLSLIYDQHGNISKINIFDLERLSFGELVNEEHIFLEALVDMKSYLLPDYWFYVLENIYYSRKATREYIPLPEVRNYLRKPSRKRILKIKVLHIIEGISGLFGPRIGMSLWKAILSSLVTINSLRYRFNGSIN